MSKAPPADNEALLARRDRIWNRQRKMFSALRQIGRALPAPARTWLAQRDPRLALLRLGDGEFVHPRYLGEFSVLIDVARSSIEREMLAGTYELSLRRLLQPHLHIGDTVIDIGANVGALTFFFAQAVGQSGKVLAFEPGPPFYGRLQANLGLNPLVQGRVETFNEGLSSEKGELFWNEDARFPGNAGMLASSGTRVSVTTLDERCATLSSCRLIKIDVEGMELEVLRGAEHTLRRLRPKIVLETDMSFEAIRKAPVRKELEAYLTQQGYRLYEMLPHAQLHPVHHPDLPVMSLAVPTTAV